MTQVALPARRQCAPSPRGPDLDVCDGRDSRARAVAVVCRLTSGVHPDSERGPALRPLNRATGVWLRTVLHTKVQQPRLDVPGAPACPPGCCSAIGGTPQPVPGPHRPEGAFAIVRTKRVGCAVRAGRGARPAPSVPATGNVRRLKCPRAPPESRCYLEPRGGDGDHERVHPSETRHSRI